MLTAPDVALAAGRDAVGRMIVATLPATLPGFFDHFCARHGETEALVDGAERVRYAELGALSDRLASVLVGTFGIEKGDRVAIAMRNSAAWIVCYMAALKAGAIATLVNGWWRQHELTHGLALTMPALILVDGERAARVAETGHETRVLTLDLDLPIGAALAPLFAGAVEAALPSVAENDDATLLFTSGSTGRAKGAVSTHRQVTMGCYTYLASTAALVRLMVADGRAVPKAPAALVALPLFHVTGEVPLMLNSFAVGRKMVLMRRWDAGEALRLIEAERVSYFVGVPTMSLEMSQHPGRERYDTASLLDIAGGGAPRPPAHVPRLVAAFPAASPMMGYGLTETNAVGCVNARGNYIAKPASTGRPQSPFVEVVILGPDGTRLPPGARGEIAIRAAAVMRGYWRDEAATAAAFTADGYFLSGDIGYADEDGYVFIVDRAKDIIIRGGENICCQELEAAIYAHPDVAEACVFGLPDERLGEVPGAVVHARAGGMDGAALIAFLEPRLARFKLPARIWMTPDRLPRLGTGKIDKVAIRRDYGALAEENI